jgi:RNA polymerase sigma-70 factor, ECF subfamily
MTVPQLEFEQIYKQFQPRIHRYLTRLTGVKDAEDLTQDVFMKVNKALPAFRNEALLSTWIYKIATNAAIDKARSGSLKEETIRESGLEEADLAAIAGQNDYRRAASGSVEDQVVRSEMTECIRRYVAALPGNYRSVVILSELEGLKDSEIASVLELSLSTVKIRLHRAREKLKQVLAANCTFYRTECNVLACEPKSPGLSGR